MIQPLLKPKDKEGRVTLTAKQKRERLDQCCKEQHMRCYLCGQRMTRLPFHMNTAVLEHIQPGKMGGCKDDSDLNTAAACAKCNMLKGSKRPNTQPLNQSQE